MNHIYDPERPPVIPIKLNELQIQVILDVVYRDVGSNKIYKAWKKVFDKHKEERAKTANVTVLLATYLGPIIKFSELPEDGQAEVSAQMLLEVMGAMKWDDRAYDIVPYFKIAYEGIVWGYATEIAYCAFPGEFDMSTIEGKKIMMSYGRQMCKRRGIAVPAGRPKQRSTWHLKSSPRKDKRREELA